MLARTHIVLGLTTALFVANFITTPYFKGNFDSITLLIIIIGALLPDLDMGTSSLARRFAILKVKHLQKIWFGILVALATLSFVYLRGTPIFYATIFIIVLGGFFSKDFANKGYHVLRNFVQGMVAIGLIAIAYYYQQLPLIGIGTILLLLLFSKHRGLSHSITFVVIIYYIVKWFCNFYGHDDYSFLFAIIVLSHIIGDMFTKTGVALFYPLSRKRIKFPYTIKTGGRLENILFFIACLFVFRLIRLL